MQVKVYGLVLLTRRQYLRQAFLGLAWLAALLLAWWLGWPALLARLNRLELPPAMVYVKMALQAAPWILLAVALLKCIEMALVLRRFARKGEAARHGSPAPVEAPHGQAAFPPVPEAGRGSEAANP